MQPSGLQTFAYASANPLRYVDPLGLESLSGDPDMRHMREERQKWYAATSDACNAGDASACASLKADEAPGFMKPFLYPMFGLTALAIGAPVAAAATPTVLTGVGAAGGGAVVVEKATMLGLLGMAAHACWDAPSLQTCGTAIGMAMLGRAAKAPGRPGPAQQTKPAGVPVPPVQAISAETQAVVESEVAAASRAGVASAARPAPGTAPALPGPGVRPSWQTSEATATETLKEAGFREQITFLGGNEVPYGTAGSVRPDFYGQNAQMSVDVKNYDLQTAAGRSRLVRNVAEQARKRSANLPAGTRQGVLLDVRGQTVDQKVMEKLAGRIEAKSGGLVKRENVAVIGGEE
jgi:hypothetical protein